MKQATELITETLESLGYTPEVQNDVITFCTGGEGCPFTVAMMADEVDVTITCQVAKKGDIADSKEIEFLWIAMDTNSMILPYSITLLSDSDGEESDENDWPIVLIDSVPVGNLSAEEVEYAVDKLNEALVVIKDLFIEATSTESAVTA
tara:strand:+ start:56002 stop:56448 length:447 start_codon:yes stop_codon:yes gene_type:complete